MSDGADDDRADPGVAAPGPDGGVTATVDSRGRRCPLPVIDLAREAAQRRAGDVLEVLADDPAAATDVPAWCQLRGHTYLGERPVGGGATALRVRLEGPEDAS